MNLGELRSEINDLAGLDLEDAEANRLLNEGYRRLIARSEWTRANLELGPTVVDQEAYALPSTVNRILKLKVDGVPFEPVDESLVDESKRNWLYLRAAGLYWLSFSPTSLEQVSLYPLPTTAGLTITAYSVVYPAALTNDDDEPAVPEEYGRAIVDYAAAIAYGADEDNIEYRSFHQGEFDRLAIELRGLRLSRTGRGVAQMRVAGWTA